MIKLELTPDEAMVVMGALNVSAVLRNTIAPVTVDQLDQGRIERDLSLRVLHAVGEERST